MTPDREAQHQARDDILAAAAIRAMVCASRGLPPSSGCLACCRKDSSTASECPAPGVCEFVENEGADCD